MIIRSVLGCVLFSLCSMVIADTDQKVSISGIVLNEMGRTIEQVNVQINQIPTHWKTPQYTLDTKAADLYQIAITAEGYYPVLQTFSHYELFDDKNGTVIPKITLVARQPGRTLFAFGGDTMMGRRYYRPLDGEPVLIHPETAGADTKALLHAIKPYLELADYTSVNLETQIFEEVPDARAPKSVTFHSPPETLDALSWAGVDYVALGNNHTFDYLDPGLEATMGHLANSDLDYSGAGSNEDQALDATRVTLNNKDYSFLSFVGWKGGFSPHQAAEGADKGGAALGSRENIAATVTREAESNRSTVVQYHGGLEYVDHPTLTTEYILKQAVESGADLVVAHHPHVTQGLELYKDKLIAYSMGNFLFDQYHYATQYSFLLYVWMDGESFHRAEIIPLHIKGYIPTPATGSVRQAMLKRMGRLSRIPADQYAWGISGGHASIGPVTRQVNTHSPQTVTVEPGSEAIVRLSSHPWNQKLTAIENDKADLRYRLGRDRLIDGDFETSAFYQSPERSWIIPNDQSGISQDHSFNGSHALHIHTSGQSVRTGMRTFERVFKPDNPMTLSGAVMADHNARINVYLQVRKRSQPRQEALDNNSLVPLGSINIAGNQSWQDFAVNFDLPRVSLISYRLLLEVAPEDQQASNVYLDQMAVIEWQTPLHHIHEQSALSAQPETTHIGLSHPNPHTTMDVRLISRH